MFNPFVRNGRAAVHPSFWDIAVSQESTNFSPEVIKARASFFSDGSKRPNLIQYAKFHWSSCNHCSSAVDAL